MGSPPSADETLHIGAFGENLDEPIEDGLNDARPAALNASVASSRPGVTTRVSRRSMAIRSAEHVVLQVCGLDTAHPLFPSVVLEVRRAQGL